MESVTMTQIEEQLRHLPPDKLVLVSEFISALTHPRDDEQQQVLRLAESSLRKDWDRPEEDEAWAHL